MYTEFSKKVLQYRLYRKMSASSLAKLCYLSPKYIYSIEQGDAERNISLDKLERLIVELSLNRKTKETKKKFFTYGELYTASYPKMDLDLNIFKDLLFSVIGLSTFAEYYFNATTINVGTQYTSMRF